MSLRVLDYKRNKYERNEKRKIKLWEIRKQDWSCPCRPCVTTRKMSRENISDMINYISSMDCQSVILFLSIPLTEATPAQLIGIKCLTRCHPFIRGAEQGGLEKLIFLNMWTLNSLFYDFPFSLTYIFFTEYNKSYFIVTYTFFIIPFFSFLGLLQCCM